MYIKDYITCPYFDIQYVIMQTVLIEMCILMIEGCLISDHVLHKDALMVSLSLRCSLQVWCKVDVFIQYSLISSPVLFEKQIHQQWVII